MKNVVCRLFVDSRGFGPGCVALHKLPHFRTSGTLDTSPFIQQ